MLCKTTMRAALAHVLATVGIVGAFGAGAAPDAPYASESLSGKSPYAITASPAGEIVLDVEIDTLLENDDDHYMVVHFWNAQLTRELGIDHDPSDLAQGRLDEDVAGTAGDPVGTANGTAPTQPMLGEYSNIRFYNIIPSRQANPNVTPAVTAVAGEVLSCGAPSTGGNTNPCLGVPTLERAFRGDETDNSGVYKISISSAGDITIDTRVRIALGAGSLAIRSKGAAKYYADLYIYETIGDARAAARASTPAGAPNTHLVHDQQLLFEVKSKIAKPKVEAHLATADVAYERQAKYDAKDNVLVSNGGPFRGFVAEGMTTKNVGVLATIMLDQITDASTKPGIQMFMDAADGGNYTGNPNTGARIVVKSAAGNFGFGNGAGTGPMGEVARKGDNPATDKVEDASHTYHAGGAPKAFMVSTDTTCMNNPLRLTVAGATPGSRMAIAPNDRDNPTMSKDATQGDATVSGAGPFYFCVLVSENEVPIPAVGDDRDMDGYKISVTPLSGTSPGPSASDQNGGSIDRNGVTVNITYLSTHPAYNQRLVIVNRGAREAEYWMDEFQTEEGTMVMSSDIRGTVPAKSRTVIRVQDKLMVNESGMARASGTLNLTAPEAEIDIMTLQVHPGTGQIDTTVY